MQVHQPWHLGMLTWTQMHAPVQKEIKNAGPSAMVFGNAHLDTDECTWLERNKQIQVWHPWHSEILICTWMDAPGLHSPERNKKMQVSQLCHSRMFLDIDRCT